jgi:hypothetical protein
MRDDAKARASDFKTCMGSLLLQKLLELRRDVRSFRVFLCRISRVRQLFDVVHETKQLPLRVDLRAATQGEAIQSLVIPYVAKHRLHRREPLRILRATLGRVDTRAHQRRLIDGRRITRPAKERDVAHGRRLGGCANTGRGAGTAHNRPSCREIVPTRSRW